MNKTIVGLGEILWDMLPGGKVLGGAPANFAYYVSRFGFDGRVVSSVGDDAPGREIICSLNEKKLAYLLEISDRPTGTVLVTLDKKGTPQYEISENVAWDNIPFSDHTENLAKRTAAVCFGSLGQRGQTSHETIRRFLKTVPDGCLKIFDINLRQHFYNKQLIEESLEIADILKINDEEAVIVSRLFGWEGLNEKDLCVELSKKYKLDIVILTKGEDGSFVSHHGGCSSYPTPKVCVADTVGAGDSFTAAFVAAYLYGNSIENAHRLAVEVSAYVCTQHGAMSDLPDIYPEMLDRQAVSH